MVEVGRDTIHVAVCTVTGAQGRALVERVQTVNAMRREMGGAPLLQVRGFTRDIHSPKAKELQELYPDHLRLVEVDYNSSKSLRKALTGCQALYLKCAVSMTQTKIYERIIDCAVRAGIEHIVYSSIVECDQEDHGIPHWESARHTEGYLAIRQDETKNAFTYHILRFAHVNDNLLTHNAPSAAADGAWIAYPYLPSVRMHTASAKDGARVACKLFCQPNSLKNGAVMNIITDFRNPHEMAQFITLATGKPVQAFKGPATFLVAGHLMGYESRSILAMGEYIEQKWTKEYVKPLKYNMEEFLREEIESEGEPLESLEAFVNRTFGNSANNEESNNS